MKTAISLTVFARVLILVTCVPASLTHAQSCNPAVVGYIIRDENGRVLSGESLESVYEKLPKTISDANPYLDEISLAADGKTHYWPESVDWPKGDKVASLQFINNKTCTMHLTEATLTYHGKEMRLIFNIDITRSQTDRRPVIDSLPFQEGTFALELNGWSREKDKVIPSDRWNRINN